MIQMLKADRIDLWFTCVDAVTDAALPQKLRLLLTPAELKSEQRYRFEKDCHRYLITRALVRTVLSRYAPIAPERWAFNANEYGKPSIASAHPLAQQISFNVSHTAGLVMVGVTQNSALGVDVENWHFCAPLDVAAVCFSIHEAADIARLPKDMQTERFYQYWTLKESYIKARGMGLAIPLHQFSFDLSVQNKVRLSIDSRLHDSPARWNVWQLRPTVDHIVAVCAERLGPRNQQLYLRKVGFCPTNGHLQDMDVYSIG